MEQIASILHKRYELIHIEIIARHADAVSDTPKRSLLVNRIVGKSNPAAVMSHTCRE